MTTEPRSSARPRGRPVILRAAVLAVGPVILRAAVLAVGPKDLVSAVTRSFAIDVSAGRSLRMTGGAIDVSAGRSLRMTGGGSPNAVTAVVILTTAALAVVPVILRAVVLAVGPKDLADAVTGERIEG